MFGYNIKVQDAMLIKEIDSGTQSKLGYMLYTKSSFYIAHKSLATGVTHQRCPLKHDFE